MKLYRSSSSRPRCIFTIDVEDWYHILDLPTTPDMATWDSLPSRVEKNFCNILDLLEEYEATATCFFLGWVAQKYPSLVRIALDRGHEIASHGYSHTLVYKMTAEEFEKDVLRGKQILEDISGSPVRGFRAAGFSTTKATPWFFEKLICAGHVYDSSVFPATRGHGGLPGAQVFPHQVSTSVGMIKEYPISVLSLFGREWCLFGGGYLRFFPYTIIRAASQKVLEEGRPVIYYLHPREIDPNHPRLEMNTRRRFKTYFNISQTESKIRRLARDFSLNSIALFEQEATTLPEWK